MKETGDIFWDDETLCITLDLSYENTFYTIYKVASDKIIEYTDIYYVDETTELHTIGHQMWQKMFQARYKLV